MSKKDSHKASLSEIFAREYRNFRQYVRRYIDERVYNTTAEDIIQDVALNMFSRPDFESPVENAIGYIYRSLKNKIIDMQRKSATKRAENELHPLEFEDEFAEIVFEADRHVDQELFYRDFYAGIERLKPEQRSIIIETELEGYSFEQLARKYDVPVGTLLARKHRAMKKLRESMEKDKYYETDDV